MQRSRRPGYVLQRFDHAEIELTSRVKIGPSSTPSTNLNSGFRMYEVDSAVDSCLRNHCVIMTDAVSDI